MPASSIIVSRPVVQASDSFIKHGLGFRYRWSAWACGIAVPTVSTGADAAGAIRHVEGHLARRYAEEVSGKSSEDGGIFTTGCRSDLYSRSHSLTICEMGIIFIGLSRRIVKTNAQRNPFGPPLLFVQSRLVGQGMHRYFFPKERKNELEHRSILV